MAPILGEFREGVPHPLRSREDETGEQTRARTTTENKKDIIKIWVSSLSVCLSLSSHNVLFLSNYLKR